MFNFRLRKFVILTLAVLSIGSVFLVILSPVVMAENEEDKPIPLEIGIAGKKEVFGITQYIETIYSFASGIVAGLAAIMIVIGGIQYATAAGNQKGISQAKETITSAIIGLVIVGAGYLILKTFGTQFTNLKEPELEIGEFPDKDNSGSFYCARTGECAYDQSGMNSSSDCSAIGESCNYVPPGIPGFTNCTERSLNECEADNKCKICDTPQGTQVCVTPDTSCDQDCTEICIGTYAYEELCMKTKESCDFACSPFPGVFEGNSCTDCGSKEGMTMDECIKACGTFPFPDNADWKNGTCKCMTKTDGYKARMVGCDSNKATMKNTCNENKCGPPQEKQTSGGKDYCCTSP